VVIINAAHDQAAGASAAKRLRRALTRSGELEPLASGDLARALEDALDRETAAERAVSEAQKLVAEAEELFDVQFKTKPARQVLTRAEELLLTVAPSPAVVTELARINFLIGLIHLREQNRGLAVSAFQVSRTLDPSRGELDAGSYKPDIVAAYKEAGARARQAASASATISATFDVAIYVDGQHAGTSPVTVSLAPGTHYAVAASREYEVAAIKIEAAQGDPVTEKVELRPIALDEQARNLRAERLTGTTGPNPGELLLLARDAVAMTGGAADAAIVIAENPAGGTLSASIYQASVGALSFFRPIDADIDEMFGLLIPTPPPAMSSRPDLFATGPAERRPWWQTRAGAVGLVTGGIVVTSLISVVVLSLANQDAQQTTRAGTLEGFGESEAAPP
jgi:hypothetical protein